MWSMRALDDLLNATDGIVSYRELKGAGWSEDLVRLLVGSRRIVRLRHGWYGAPRLPLDVRRAWAAGGPLGCISALVHHGVVRADDLRHDPDAVHVTLARSARPPSTLGRDVGDAPIIWHYSDAALSTRRAIDTETARRQFAHCGVRSIDKAAEVRRRVVERERRDEERWAQALAAMPPWGST